MILYERTGQLKPKIFPSAPYARLRRVSITTISRRVRDRQEEEANPEQTQLDAAPPATTPLTNADILDTSRRIFSDAQAASLGRVYVYLLQQDKSQEQ